MSALQVDSVVKSYGRTQVLQGISLSVQKGEQIALQGASGSGKSTLLYLMGGLDRPDQGDVFLGETAYSSLGDRELASLRNRSVGFVFQHHFLLSSLTCWQNILLPWRISRSGNREEVEQRVKKYAELLGVGHCFTKYPYQLSGGEQQRVNVIRAISLHPSVLLCDEPTGNLDSHNSQKVVHLLQGLAHELGAALVFVTHDRTMASFFGRHLLIEDGRLKT